MCASQRWLMLPVRRLPEHQSVSALRRFALDLSADARCTVGQDAFDAVIAGGHFNKSGRARRLLRSAAQRSRACVCLLVSQSMRRAPSSATVSGAPQQTLRAFLPTPF